MTDAEIDALEAGPDLDRKVAAALGWRQSTWGFREAWTNGLRDADGNWDRTFHFGPEDAGGEFDFLPSVDWNDAMFAAERFGLAPSTHALLDCYVLKRLPIESGPVYAVAEIDMMRQGEEWIAHDRSGPLAICRAILKLHHRRGT